MSDPRDRGGDRNVPLTDDPSPQDAPTAAADDQRSGRVSYDERGNPVWEWKLETGVYSRDVTTDRLKKLELNDLSIADTAKHARPPGLGGDSSGSDPMPGGGFNPYDNSTTARGNIASNPYNGAGRGALKPEPDPTEPRPRRPLDLKKLQEWIELRKRVQQNKLEEDDDD